MRFQEGATLREEPTGGGGVCTAKFRYAEAAGASKAHAHTGLSSVLHSQWARVAGESDVSCRWSWHHLMPSQLCMYSHMLLLDWGGPGDESLGQVASIIATLCW